jgi:hypothetical protein
MAMPTNRDTSTRVWYLLKEERNVPVRFGLTNHPANFSKRQEISEFAIAKFAYLRYNTHSLGWIAQLVRALR